MSKSLSVLCLAAALLLAGCHASDKRADLERQVEEVLAQMTLDEKIAMIHAQSKFSAPGVPRLGIPELWCDDGPHGVRPDTFWDKWSSAGQTNDSCTAYPSLTCLAASWNRDLAYRYGRSVGEEARYRKKNVLLGPGVNICRTPLNGRNFEYMGEDPYLAGELAARYVQGVQSNKVAACVKHFALNNQEYHRMDGNVNVDDRALYEIYLPAFKKAVQQGGAWSVMGAYNQYDASFACHNARLLKEILKGEWGFDGAAISDWGGVHDTEGAARGGLDIEFGTSGAYDDYYLAEPYKAKLVSGELSEDELNDKVRRALRLNFRTRADGYSGSFLSPEHTADCRRIGGEGIVLLRNNGVLPMAANARRIVVLGENAIRPMVVGGSSSSLKAQHEISPLQGIRNAFPEAEVVYCRTYYSGMPTPGSYNYSQYDITETRPAGELLTEALAAVEDADYVVFVGGLNKNETQDCEGRDRLSYELPFGQDAIVERIAAARPDLVYVNISGSPVALPFADKVGAVVQAWYLGSETGNALADVLSGAVNPSGKLPFSFPVSLEEGPLKSERQYPGFADEKGVWQVYYDEGIYVGYRWYDLHGGVQFPFGYGLSYTTFEYGQAKASAKVMKDRLTVSIPLTNTGDRAGAEVVQLYIADEEASVDRPVKELKGFEKVWLEPGETKTVSFTIGRDALSFFDASRHVWVAEPGSFKALVGASSADIRSEVSFSLK